jgi:uncharacterized 2Fe-2S/4Fe-4S cluster protein (DUF4445 family)
MKQIKNYNLGVACSAYGETRDAYGILVDKTEGKTSRRRYEDNIQMNFSRRIVEVVDWIDMVQDRNKRQALVVVTRNFLVSLNAGNFFRS